MNWYNELPLAITVSDKDGKILYMNSKSKNTFEKNGESLIGKSLFDCHGEKAKQKILELISTEGTNAYTIEKQGVKKLIYQCPWRENGEFMGLIELSIVLPEVMPHFVRK